MSKHYIGEIGTRLLMELESEISTYDSLYLNIKKPNNDIEHGDAVIVSGIYIEHIVASGDFDQKGIYIAQPFIAMSGWSGLGDSDTFEIHSRYC